MTRSEFDDIRAFLADKTTHLGDLLGIANVLIDDLEHARLREAALRNDYLRLLTAARATVAAAIAGEPDPLAFIRHELAERGQLPEDDEAVQRILADAHAAAAFRAYLEARPTGVRPDENRPQEGRAYEGRPSEGRPHESRPYESRSHEGRPDESRLHEDLPHEGRPRNGRLWGGQPHEGPGIEGRAHRDPADAGQLRPGQPAAGKPGETEPRDGLAIAYEYELLDSGSPWTDGPNPAGPTLTDPGPIGQTSAGPAFPDLSLPGPTFTGPSPTGPISADPSPANATFIDPSLTDPSLAGPVFTGQDSPGPHAVHPAQDLEPPHGPTSQDEGPANNRALPRHRGPRMRSCVGTARHLRR